MKVAIILSALIVITPALGATFGGYECTDDCSGHSAGYEWGEQHNVASEQDCPEGRSQSFYEGCVVYTEDSSRGSEEDDDGNSIDK